MVRANMAGGIWRSFLRNKTFQYGVPMLLLIIGGSFGLREFAQIRYDALNLHGRIDPALEEKLKNSKVSLESEYEKIKDASLNDWKNIRGPRPWEDSNTLQNKQQ